MDEGETVVLCSVLPLEEGEGADRCRFRCIIVGDITIIVEDIGERRVREQVHKIGVFAIKIIPEFVIIAVQVAMVPMVPHRDVRRRSRRHRRRSSRRERKVSRGAWSRCAGFLC